MICMTEKQSMVRIILYNMMDRFFVIGCRKKS